jgi:O-antigen/teichoic acid export membrane protein
MNLVSNIITTLFARVGVLICAVISSIVLARVLGPEGRGLFALIILLPEMATAFGLLGFDHANVVYAGLEPESRRALVWHSTVLAIVLGVAFALAMMGYIVLGAPGFPVLARGPRSLFLLALSLIPATILIDYWFSILRGMNHIALTNAVEIGAKVASLLILIVFLLWFRLGVAGAVATNFVMTLGTLILAVVLLRHVGVLGKPSFDWSLWKRTARFALPSYAATVLAYMNYRVDQLCIAIFLPPEQLGYYVLAVSLAERLWILTGAVANALLPHLANSKERELAIPAVVTRHVVLWTGAGCLIVFVLADVLIRVLYSPAFADGVAPLRWLLPGILVATMGKNLCAELLVRKMVGYLVWMAGVGAVVNLVGNLLLVPRMGISGAALASTISYCVLSLVQTGVYLKITGVPWTTLVPRWSDMRIYYVVWRRILNALGIQKLPAEAVWGEP